MNLPQILLEKKLSRFEKLILEGRSILESSEHLPAATKYSDFWGEEIRDRKPYLKIERIKFFEWRIKAADLLCQVVPKTNVHWEAVEYFPKLPANIADIEWGISMLTAIKEDLEQGFLNSLSTQIEAEIAADYMGQAEGLLMEGASGKCDHVPAAVLSGAVLEKALRTLCEYQQPPIATINEKGRRITLNPMIDALKKAGIFSEAKAKQLIAWASIRNHAAHGEFDEFGKTDVEQMLQGIKSFLVEHCR